MSAPDGQSIVDRVVNGETSRQERTRQKGAVCFEFEKDGEETRTRVAQDVDPSANDAITTSEPDARDYADELPKHPLPGFGEERVDCGRPMPELGCENCWSTKDIGRTCRNPDCPRCNKSWAFHRAVDMGAKLHDLSKKVPEQVFKHHLTVSFRDSTRFNSKDPFKRGLQAVKSLLHLANVQTGYAVYHAWRITPEYRGNVLGHESGEGDMTWKDIDDLRESEAWSWEAIREEFLVYAPHFHIVCLSGFVDTTGVGEIEEQTGVVIHRITTKRKDGKERSIADVDELAKVLAYTLTHTGITPDSEKKTHRADVRAFGQVANHDVGKKAKSRMEVKESMRKAAPKVLGIEFPDPTCNKHVPKDHDHGHSHGHDHAATPTVAHTALAADGGSSSPTSPGTSPDASSASPSSTNSSSAWDETAGMVPSGLDTATSGQTESCEGQMVPLPTLEPKLGDLSELNRIESQFGEERVHELRHQLERRRELLDDTEGTFPGEGADPPDR